MCENSAQSYFLYIYDMVIQQQERQNKTNKIGNKSIE